MAQILLVACCFLGCPLLVGAMMLGIGRDHQGRGLEREFRRINAAAEMRRAARDLSALQQVTTSPHSERQSTALHGREWPILAEKSYRPGVGEA